MTKYRNPRKEAEAFAAQQEQLEEEIMEEPAKSVEEETWKKRYGDQQRYLNQIKNENKSKIEELERKLDQALRGQIKAPKSQEEVEAWRKEYPEFDGILKTLISEEIRQATSHTTEKLVEIERTQQQLEQEKAVLALKKLHPDLDELTRNQDFHDWLSNQREKYRNAIYNSLDVDEADFVISKYKTETKKSKSKVEDDFDAKGAAKVVRTPSSGKEPVEDFGDYDFTESQIERESKKNRGWYSANEAKIMEAARKGRILHDISGGARAV